MGLVAKVLTVSDSVASGAAEDRSGPALAEHLEASGFTVSERAVSSDDTDEVIGALRGLCEGFAGLVVTTGGTGLAPRDVTPEATMRVIERPAPGLAEAMRLADPLGRLSRGVAGAVGECLVLNTPGSPEGSVAFLASVIDVLPHALALLSGETAHHRPPASA